MSYVTPSSYLRGRLFVVDTPRITNPLTQTVWPSTVDPSITRVSSTRVVSTPFVYITPGTRKRKYYDTSCDESHSCTSCTFIYSSDPTDTLGVYSVSTTTGTTVTSGQSTVELPPSS